MTDILVIAPHADDMELGCGGFLTRECGGGRQAHVVIVSMSPYVVAHTGSGVTVEQRMAEAQAGADILGASLESWDLPENRLHLLSMGELVGRLDAALDRHRPDTLLIPLPSVNQDHVTVHDACMAATRPSKAWSPRRIMAYEYPMNCWGPPPPATGKVYAPLTSQQVLHKVSALRQHMSQVNGREDSLAAIAGVEALVRIRGLEAGVEFAEMFYLLREVA